MKVKGIEIESDRAIGRDEGFLAIRRVKLRNRRADGSLSERYVCDFAERPIGRDAVVVALYHRDPEGVRVLVREGLRPAMALGRPGEGYLFFSEVVAGILEDGDEGEEGIKRRAALEVEEEAGYRVDAAEVDLLGRCFPSPGSLPERFWLAAVEVADPADQRPLEGDGSPMEEGASTRWLGLEEAIDLCERGDIEDMKTELILRRLRARLTRR